MKSIHDVRNAVRDLAEQDDESGPWHVGEAIVEWLDDSLDAAWVEAEAALWEGGWLRVTGNPMSDYLPGPSYRAEAFKPHATVSLVDAIADTPAAALRALAAKLRERAG